MPELQFDEATHTYSLDGRPLDGLTSTIKEAGLIRSNGDQAQWYMQRGKYIHLATELHDRGELDESTLDPQIVPYLESWKRFRGDQGYEPSHTELKLYDPIYLYAGTIDRLPLCDLKSGAEDRWHKWQLAGYWNLCKVNGFGDQCSNPFNVYLDEDGGPPKIRNYTQAQMREALKDFLCILQFVRLKNEK
jgi:hypothetical protein